MSDGQTSDESDSEGSLCDFIVPDTAATPIVNGNDTFDPVREFPYDISLLNETDTGGPRRSKRQKKTVKRYQDADYKELMLTCCGTVDVEAVLQTIPESTKEAADEDYVLSDNSDESDGEDV